MINASPEEVWKRCGKDGGISKDEFFEYFDDKDSAIALQIDEFKEYIPIDPWQVINQFYPPQSYQYLSKDDLLLPSEIIVTSSKL